MIINFDSLRAVESFQRDALCANNYTILLYGKRLTKGLQNTGGWQYFTGHL
jgi:hypothetical protein